MDYTIQQAAEIMDIFPTTLYKFVKAGIIPTHKKNGRPRKYISAETVARWLAGEIKTTGFFVLEKRVQRHVLNKIKKEKLFIKYVKISKQSWPDYLFFLPNGNTCFIEFKKLDGEPRVEQEKTINMLRDMGHTVECFDEAPQAFVWLKAQYTRAVNTVVCGV